MPYTVSEPPAAFEKLPDHAIEIGVAAFNSAYDGTCAEREDRESCAMAIAWSAIKTQYEQNDAGEWHEKEQRGAMNPFRKLFEQVRAVFEPHLTERAISMSDLQDKIYGTLYPPGTERDPETVLDPIDLYHEGSEMYLLCSGQGRIWRVNVTLGADDSVTLGERIEIPIPSSESRSVTVIRQKDGKARWLAIAATAALNRDGQIDSRALFDSFIARAEETKEYPELRFYHQGDLIRFGQADYLARDDALYLAAGTFDETDLARAAMDALEKDSQDWATSIGFDPLEKPTFIEVARGVKIPVYTKGENIEISIVPVDRASSLLTSIGVTQEVKRMRKEVYEALVKLVGKDNAEPFKDRADTANRAAQNMVTRDVDEEKLIAEIVKRAMSAEEIKTMVEQMAQMQTMLADMAKQMGAAVEESKTVQQAINAVDARLKELEGETPRGFRASQAASTVTRDANKKPHDDPKKSYFETFVNQMVLGQPENPTK